MAETLGTVMVGRPPEWWERAQDWRTRWLLRRPALLRRLVKWGAVGALAIAVYEVVLALLLPITRWPLGAYAGTYWALTAWFLLARTKTLAWPTVSAMFGTLLVWSGVVGFVSFRVITAAGLSPNSPVAAASAVPIIEESGKLLPVAVLAAVVPGRVRRMSMADWLLLGLVSGLAYEGMEEGLRRIYYLTAPSLSFCVGDPGQVLTCRGANLYGLWPFSSAFGSAADYAGHGIVTAMVTISIGLALRISTSRSLPPWRYLAWLWPCWLLWVALVTHSAINGSPERGPIWDSLRPYQPPWFVQLTSTVTLHGHAAVWFLLLLLIGGTLLDARTFRRHNLADLLAPGQRSPGRAEHLHERIAHTLRGSLADGAKAQTPWCRARLGRASLASANDAWYLVFRDIIDIPRAVAAASGWSDRLFAAIAVPRTSRIARASTLETCNGPLTRRLSIRLCGLLSLTLLLGAILCLAVASARHVSADQKVALFQAGNTAGLWQQIGKWWEEQPAWVKGAVIIGAGMVVIATGGSAAAALAVGGGTLWTLDHAAGIGTFMNNPGPAAEQYLDTHNPGQIGMDVAGAALSFAPVGSTKLILGTGTKLVNAARAATRGNPYIRAVSRNLLDVPSLAGSATEASIASRANLTIVADHLASIDALGSHAPNVAMIGRIERAIAEGRELTPGERNFMTHELAEAAAMARGVEQDVAHQMALETHPLFQNYDPEVIMQFPEYFNSNWRTAWGLL